MTAEPTTRAPSLDVPVLDLDVQVLGLAPDLVDYHDAWALQRQRHALVAAGQAPETVFLLEHHPVYTAGRRTASYERPFDGTPVVDVDRGGKITWHGPGQLVGYPIVRLADPVDVVAYVRRLEQVLIDVCAELGLTACRVEGRSGVWLPADTSTSTSGADPNAGPSAVRATGRRERKVAAIGIRVAQGVTMHGFALNADPDLEAFGQIVPCGIPDADVTSLSAELGRRVTVAEVLPLVSAHLRTADLCGRGAARTLEVGRREDDA